MECTIYTPQEVKKKLTVQNAGVAVIACFHGDLILLEDGGRWRLPAAGYAKGESIEETAQRALGEAMGEAVYTVSLLCGFSVTEEDGRERGGLAFTAEVTDWPDEGHAPASAFHALPEAGKLEAPVLIGGLKRWAWPLFDRGRAGDVSAEGSEGA